jgi:hypothetical protein
LSPKHLLLSAALTAAALAGARPAAAYCLTHGCNEATQDCEFDRNGCLVETETSPRLFWRSECISFDVQKDGSARRNIPYEAARDAIHEAFRQWLNADCGDGQGPSVRIEDYGPVECRKAEYNQQAGNANIVMFRDDSWPYTNAIDTLALTTLIFNADTGEIYDADILRVGHGDRRRQHPRHRFLVGHHPRDWPFPRAIALERARLHHAAELRAG